MYKQQQGAVLIVSLSLLLVITLAGVSAIQMALLEEKMARNHRDYQLAFQNAEATLAEGEHFAINEPFTAEHWQNGCSDNNRCFQDDCTAGLCRTIDSPDANQCDLKHDAPWQNSSVWKNSGYHRQAKLTGGGRYIIEFRCFTPSNTANRPESPPEAGRLNGAPLFRVTALAYGGTQTAQVMLQSTIQRPTTEPESTPPATETSSEVIKDTALPPLATTNLYQQRTQLRRSWQQIEPAF